MTRSTRTRDVTGTLARASAQHPWRVLTVWLVLTVGAVVASITLLGGALSQEPTVSVELESETAEELIAEARAAMGDSDDDALVEYVVVESLDGSDFADPAATAMLQPLVDEVRATANVTSVVSPLDGAPTLVSADGRHALLQVTLAEGDEPAELAVPLIETLAHAEPDGYRVATVGNGSVTHEFNRLAERTLLRGEVLGLSAALVVLVLVFGAVVAALVPLALAVVAIIVAMGMTALVGQVTDLSIFVVNMITMIGLAVGIDYSLFIVQRFREERQAGRTIVDAVGVAGATASRAVLFSGITVVIALVGMLFMPDTLFRSLGIGAILVVVAAVLGALTLLPAILGLLGDRVNRLRLPFAGRHRPGDGLWGRVARTVMARPVIAVVLAGGVMVALAVPWASIQLGSSGIDSLPADSDTRYAYGVLNDQFDGGVTSTAITISADDVADPDVTAAAQDLVAALEADSNHGEVTMAPLADDLLVVDAVTLLDPSTDEGREAVIELREETIPAIFDGVDAEVLVTGEAAWDVDYTGLINDRTPWIFAFVLGMSFLLLLLAFRSVIVPLKAVVMNLLSVGATYGLMVLVFQRGIGADLLGFQTADVIEAWVPLLLFTVLFGLSMDYHVFLLSRIRERYDLTGDNTGSVVSGLSVTGSIITGAALIMVAVFGGFAAGDLAQFQQMGFGLAVAVILDATVVRSILVPAAMALLGDRNWYFPSWLEWLPHVHVEGHPSLAAPAPSTADGPVQVGT